MKTKPLIELDLGEVERLAARGLTVKKIAEALGVSEATIYKRQRDSEEFKAAIKKGRAKGEADIADTLFEAAKAGNTAAMIFYLKARCGWSEKQEIEVSGDTGPKIVFIENVPD